MAVKTSLLVAATLCGIGGAALAEPARKSDYKAADIVSHFAPDLGPSRALCIGTESECAKSIEQKPRITNFDLVVNFEYNSATLTKSARANLDQFAAALKDPRLGKSSFAIEGYTDGKGGDEFNLDLSSRRAGAVVEYLQSQGVPSGKLEAKGYGKQNMRSADPMDPSNRRVETRIRTE